MFDPEEVTDNSPMVEDLGIGTTTWVVRYPSYLSYPSYSPNKSPKIEDDKSPASIPIGMEILRPQISVHDLHEKPWLKEEWLAEQERYEKDLVRALNPTSLLSHTIARIKTD